MIYSGGLTSFCIHIDETISENECAMRFLDIVNIKASFPIGALYLALHESSNEQYGPPTHHQLACELKRIGEF